jgi:hypothetical protein
MASREAPAWCGPCRAFSLRLLLRNADYSFQPSQSGSGRNTRRIFFLASVSTSGGALRLRSISRDSRVLTSGSGEAKSGKAAELLNLKMGDIGSANQVD